jgi:hypothetical protein
MTYMQIQSPKLLLSTLLLIAMNAMTIAQSPRLVPHCPENGKGGTILKVQEQGRRVLLGVPKAQNMYNIYFNVCIENIPSGDFYIRAISDNPDKLPAYAVYRFSPDQEWCYAPLEDSVTYRIDVPKGTHYVQFASGIPYSYGDMLNHVYSLSDDYLQVFELDRKSIQGNAVKVLKITDCTIEDEYKQAAWIIGGQHVYELPSLQTVKHTIDYLVSDDPDAAELRKRMIFYICPIADVDASIKGLSGKRIVGRGIKSDPTQDLNWDWNVTLHSKHPVQNTKGGPNSFDNISHPQIKSLQNMIYATAAQNPLRFFIDHHSPFPLASAEDDTLAFHVIDKYLPLSKKSYNNPDSYQRKFWDHYRQLMGFGPIVLHDQVKSQGSAQSNKPGHSYSYGPGEQFDYERSADYWVDSDNALYFRNTLAQPNMFFSTTIETGWYHTPIINQGPHDWWTEEVYRLHAEAICKSMLHLVKDYPEPTPNDRVIDIVRDKKTFKFKGDWKETATQIPNTIIHHMNGLAFATTTKGASIEFPIAPKTPGIYDVYIWAEPMYRSPFNPLPNQCISDANVQVRISDGDQLYFAYIDQTKGGGSWKKITTLYLDPSNNPTVSISKISDDQTIAIADAIRITPSSGLPQEPVSYKDK